MLTNREKSEHNAPIISVIVPIYKAESYLHRCVDSIINQTHQNLEIILINDGSPDRCGEICDEYARRDNRIKVIHKKNGGQSDARNAGMRIATGKYIAFVDNDDYLTADAYEILLREAQKYDLDIAVGNGAIIRDENPGYIKRKIFKAKYLEQVVSGYEYMYYQHKNNDYQGYIWTKLYKKDFLAENNSFFERGLVWEDYVWTWNIFLKANKVKYVDHLVYYYIFHKSSTTSNYDKNAAYYIDSVEICYKLMLNCLNLKNAKHRKIFAKAVVKRYLRRFAKIRDYKSHDNLLKHDKTISLKLAPYNFTYLKALLFAVKPQVYVAIFSCPDKIKTAVKTFLSSNKN